MRGFDLPPRAGKTLLLVLCLMQPGCEGRLEPVVSAPVAEPSPFAALLDRSISGPSLLAFPGPGWFKGSGPFWLNDEATMIFVVREPGDPLTFEVRAEAIPPLRIFWNEDELPPTLVSRDEGSLRVEILPSLQAPGTNELTLRVDDASVRVVVESLAVRGKGVELAFSPENRLVYSYLAGLSGYGVTGITSHDQLGGFAFVGPRDETIPISSGRRVAFTLENGSHSNADFILTGGGSILTTTVPPLGRTSVALDVPPGAESLTFGTRGDHWGLFLWGSPMAHPSRAGGQPPIVLITLDTTRKDALGPYGGDERLTPAISEFAKSATVYRKAFSTSPWTLPAHASIFTGLYPANHGAGVTSRRLVATHRTLAELLREGGYDTAGYPGGLLGRVNWGVAQGFQTYRDPRDEQVPDAELTDLALARIEGAGTAPLFLFVNYFGPHFPYVASESAMQRSGATNAREAEGVSRRTRMLLDGDADSWGQLVDRKFEPTPADEKAIRLAYLAGVADTDAEVGRLLGGLKRHGLYDDALIVIVADHGELLGEDGFYSHTTRLDDALVEVPLLVKWPGQTRGRVERELVSIVDLFPTILSTAGLRPPPSDGLGLFLDRDAIAEREYVVAEEHDRPSHRLFESMLIAKDVARLQTRHGYRLVTNGGSSCHVRRGKAWKEVDCEGGSSPVVPEVPLFVARSMDDRRTGRPELTEEQIHSLRALGYIR